MLLCNAQTGLCTDGMDATTNGANLGQWADSSSANQQRTTIAAS